MYSILPFEDRGSDVFTENHNYLIHCVFPFKNVACAHVAETIALILDYLLHICFVALKIIVPH